MAILAIITLAVCLAFLVWLYSHSRAGDSTDFVQVPVQIQLPPHQRDQFAIEYQGQSRECSIVARTRPWVPEAKGTVNGDECWRYLLVGREICGGASDWS